ncbi:hypothetical protein [Corynebacterium uterequi]|uniref:Uncharacterized protein n=1 Tax=Corynebacterium uterequi TaxID=1072256 RepID=A0A0G3HDF9_9CORY|nr:hypothetical protein [Corynebacterium uterequi]AKK10730.1 hypothetical protein CUTER_03610 [Corynebacterium uterequi]
MLSAVVLAFTDSVNALLIAVILALGIILPRGHYRLVTPLLIAGDWLGVYLLALLVMVAFDGAQGFVHQLTSGPWLGIVLIVIGALAAIGAWRARPGGDQRLVELMLAYVSRPGWVTAAAGFVLGVVQSATSAPFYGGIAILSAGDFSALTRYGGMVWYATAALSLPAAVAAAVGWVRAHPESPAGRLMLYARGHATTVSKLGGYAVAVVLISIGIIHL